MTNVLMIKMRVGGIETRFKGCAVVMSDLNDIYRRIEVTRDFLHANFDLEKSKLRNNFQFSSLQCILSCHLLINIYLPKKGFVYLFFLFPSFD